MIKSPIPFGAVYILQPERPWSDIPRDLDYMKACGFDLVTLWPASNPWLAEKATDFVFTDTLRFLDECHARDIKVLVQLIGQNQAYEFMPDTLMTPELHATFDDFKDRNCFWANLGHPAVDAAIEHYLKIAVAALHKHPAVFGWDIFNEAHLRSDDPHSLAAFQRWLEKRYGTIRALNLVWQRRYASFSEIDTRNRNSPYSRWSSLVPGTDYVEFCAEYLDHWIARWVAHVKSVDPVHPVIVDGTSNQIIGGEISWRNNDQFATARLVDWFGGTYYPKSWGRNMTDAPWEFALYYETSCSAARKAGKPYYISEIQTHTQSALTPHSEVAPDELAAWLWLGLSIGPAAVQLWRWSPFLNGYQASGRGLTRVDSTPGPRAAAVTKLVTHLSDNAAIFSAAKPAAPAVRFITSYRDRAFHDAFSPTVALYSKNIFGWFRAFWDLGHPADLTELGALDASDFAAPILVMPSMLSLTPEEIARLRSYVEQGGTLIADARMGVINQHGIVPHSGVPGDALASLFGFRETEVGHESTFQLDGETCEASFLTQEIETEADVAIHARFPNGKPAIISRKVGRGHTYYFSAMIGQGWGTNNITPAIHRFLAKVIAQHAPGAVTFTKSKYTHARWHALPGGTRLLYITNLSPKPGSIDLTPLASRTLNNLLADNAAVAAAPCELGPWETKVLRCA